MTDSSMRPAVLRKTGPLIAGLAAVAIAVIAISLSSGGTSTASAEATKPVEPAGAHFAVIAQTDGATGVRLSAVERGVLDTFAQVAPGATPYAPGPAPDWSRAGEALRTPDGSRLLIAPGDGAVCFALLSTSADGRRASAPGGCQRTDRANNSGAQLSLGNGRVAGIVPDGVESVTFTLADGSSERVSVQRNGYYYAGTGAQAPVEIAFDGPAGRIAGAAVPPGR